MKWKNTSPIILAPQTQSGSLEDILKEQNRFSEPLLKQDQESITTSSEEEDTDLNLRTFHLYRLRGRQSIPSQEATAGPSSGKS